MTAELLDALGTYARLTLYPVLAYTLVIYAWGVLADKNRSYAHIATMLSMVFMMLWGTAIIFYVTGDTALMYDFGSIGILPILFITIVYMWISIYRHSKQLRNQRELSLKTALEEKYYPKQEETHAQ